MHHGEVRVIQHHTRSGIPHDLGKLPVHIRSEAVRPAKTTGGFRGTVERTHFDPVIGVPQDRTTVSTEAGC